MKRLNIFVDETGEFGFSENASELFGVSFTFHEQADNIISELNMLNSRLYKIGYTDMIHMADLIMKRGDYSKFGINTRKDIFKAVYHFLRKIPVKYQTIIIDKKYANNGRVLRKQLLAEIKKMVEKHEEYFGKFEKIVMYYDNGQEVLGNILKSVFSIYNGFEHRDSFDHKKKRLFQVSDMLTYIDKCDYKYKNKKQLTKGEKYFFSDDELRKITRELAKKRF